MRLFIAFPIRTQTADCVLSVSKSNAELSGVKWTIPENLHVTLFFIGNALPESFDAIKHATKEIIEHTKSFQLQFDKYERHKKIIWAAFKKEKSFSDLYFRLRDTLLPFIPKPELNEDPLPHITLARIKKEYAEEVDFKNAFSPGTIEINKTELWESISMHDGVRYLSRSKYSLAV